MSKIARTPVNFPRMKVRGRRNKFKMLRTKFQYFTSVIPFDNGGGRYTFTVSPSGTHRMVFTYFIDGWGRRFNSEK